MLLKHLEVNLSPRYLFPELPIVIFRSSMEECSCGKKLTVLKTSTKKVSTLEIGEFIAHETQIHCNECGRKYYSDELYNLIPNHCRYGFDIINFVGEALFVRYKEDAEIQEELRRKSIPISLREISYLGKKFIVYLALVHQESHSKIKSHMQLRGGYILHLDGTCEADSPHLLSSIDELSDIVLGNLKIPSENASKIIPFLMAIKEKYGDPIALVHDMGKGIINAIKKVFPNVFDYICHFHFLKDIGKDLFETQYSNIRRQIKSYRVRTKLREILTDLKRFISGNPKLQNCLCEYLASKDLKKPAISLMPAISTYITIAWVLEAGRSSNGFGFPFDRVHLDFYLRLREAYPALKKLQRKLNKDNYKLQLSLINRFLQDTDLKNTINIIQKKITYFDKLRTAMRIALPDNKAGLNDDGDTDIKFIEKQVTVFRKSDELEKLASTDISYSKMLKQIDKYWDKLFADPIKVRASTGTIIVQPQRTNNIMEQFFREIKRGYRKKSGSRSLSRTLKSMLAETPLVKNLANPEYLKIILNGKDSLPERFADIDIERVRSTMITETQKMQKYPEGMAKIFKIPHLPNKLVAKYPRKASFG